MIIDVLKYIILGLVQGITEVLPISSSAHLLIFGEMLNINDDSMFLEVMLHVASLIAVVFFMRHKLLELINGFFKYLFKKDKQYLNEFRYVIYIILSTTIVVLFTLLFKGIIDKVTSSLSVVGILLIINGISLHFFSKKSGNKTSESMNYKDALVVGLFECMGVFPGISRSGSCLCGGLTRGLDKETAADYAFMLFIPACLGGLVLELVDFSVDILDGMFVLYLISFIVSLVSTYFAYKLFLKVIKCKKLSWFSVYTIILGLIVFLFNIIK